jgi:hypothetical protein
MGALIQTKGTQRLSRLLNNRFDDSSTGIGFARLTARSSVCSLADAFADPTLDLLDISDRFIAQNAVSGAWPADGNDYLYPGATLSTTNTGSTPTNVVNFTLPTGFAALPSAILANAPVTTLQSRRIPKGTVVGAVSAVAAGKFNVTLVDKTGAPVNVVLNTGEMVSFSKNKNGQLIRRWRWYLGRDLKPENHSAIRIAISSALSDTSFTKILFQTVEDVQRVLITPQSKLNANDELDDDMYMHVLLLTLSTTAPDKLDPQ